MNENKSSSDALIVILIIISLLSITNYLMFMNEHFNFFNINNQFVYIIKKYINIKDLYFRIGIVSLIFSHILLNPNPIINFEVKKEERKYHHILSVILVTLFIIGYTLNKYYAIAFPFIALCMIYFLGKSLNDFFDTNSKNKSSELSCEPENDMSFDLLTTNGILRIHSPQQGVSVAGGAGAGKSASNIEPALIQMINKGYCGVIYDFKGNPPTLGTTAFNALLNRPKTYKLNGKEVINPSVKFGIINFSNLNQTVRCNPIHPSYINDNLQIKEISTLILCSLNREWVTKKDFWADNAISILHSTIKMLRNNYPQYCTLPHAISVICSDGNTLLNWLASDEDVAADCQSVLTAYRNNASGQLAGALSSVQMPMSNLRDKAIYYVLGSDDFSLDINNKSNPTILAIANNPSLKKALAPVISLIIKTCMNNMNMQGKNKSFLLLDEFPQIYLPEIYDFPATARSNKCVTYLGYQGNSQQELGYGKQQAEAIIANMGNVFQGMCNELSSAEGIVKLFGEEKQMDTSVSQSQNSVSQSYSNKNEKIIQAKDVMGQKSGHFMGKVANGNPPLFSEQFAYVDHIDNNYYHILNNQKTFLFERKLIPDFLSVSNIEIDENFNKINSEVSLILDPFKSINNDE